MKPVTCGCGGEAIVNWDIENGYYTAWVCCSKCNVKTGKYMDRYCSKKVKDYAIKAWNNAMGCGYHKFCPKGHDITSKLWDYCPICGEKLER